LTRSNASPTRQRILEAATSVFSERGYHGASVDDIVAASNTSKGSFYFHFPNKEGLFLALVEDFAARLIEEVYDAVQAEEGKGAITRVRAALRAGVGALLRRPALAKIFLVEAVGLNPQFEGKRREIYRALAKLISGYLDAAVETGDLPPQPTELAAYLWLGAISESVVYTLESGGPVDLDELAETLTGYVLRAVGYAAPEACARREPQPSDVST